MVSAAIHIGILRPARIKSAAVPFLTLRDASQPTTVNAANITMTARIAGVMEDRLHAGSNPPAIASYFDGGSSLACAERVSADRYLGREEEAELEITRAAGSYVF